jgi:hypothetical protein
MCIFTMTPLLVPDKPGTIGIAGIICGDGAKRRDYICQFVESSLEAAH